MQSGNSKGVEKENIAQTLNHLPKEKFNMSIPNLALLDKPNKKQYSRQNIPEIPVRCTSKTSIVEDFTPSISFIRTENINMIREYSEEFIVNTLNKVPYPDEFLNEHEINGSLRAKMVDWMIEVFSSYKFHDLTFFKAVAIMDAFFSKAFRSQHTKDLHLIGVTSIFMSTKLDEIYPLKLKTIYEKIAHKKLTIQAIKEKECEMLHCFQFNTQFTSVFDIVTLCLGCLEVEPQPIQLQQLCSYIAKACVYDYNICSSFNLQVMASAVLFLAFRMYEQLNKEFSADQSILKVQRMLSVTKQLVSVCSSQLLKLIKNFDKHYPNLCNLKKFSKFNLEGTLGL